MTFPYIMSRTIRQILINLILGMKPQSICKSDGAFDPPKEGLGQGGHCLRCIDDAQVSGQPPRALVSTSILFKHRTDSWVIPDVS